MSPVPPIASRVCVHGAAADFLQLHIQKNLASFILTVCTSNGNAENRNRSMFVLCTAQGISLWTRTTDAFEDIFPP